MLDGGAIGGDGGDAAVDDRTDDDVAVTVDAHGIAHGEVVGRGAGDGGDDVAVAYLARGRDVEGPEASRGGLGDVEGALVRAETDAVGGLEGEDDLADEVARGRGVEDARDVAGAAVALAVVGEVEVALTVEDEVVGTLQGFALALAVDDRDLGAVGADALDLAADVVVGAGAGRDDALAAGGAALGPLKAAVLGDVDGPVGAESGAVGTAPGGGEGLAAGAIGRDAGERVPARISVKRMSPSGSSRGPSANSMSVATTRYSMGAPLAFAPRGAPGASRRRPRRGGRRCVRRRSRWRRGPRRCARR